MGEESGAFALPVVSELFGCLGVVDGERGFEEALEVKGEIKLAEGLDGFLPGFGVFVEDEDFVDVGARSGDIGESFVANPGDVGFWECGFERSGSG